MKRFLLTVTAAISFASSANAETAPEARSASERAWHTALFKAPKLGMHREEKCGVDRCSVSYIAPFDDSGRGATVSYERFSDGRIENRVICRVSGDELIASGYCMKFPTGGTMVPYFARYSRTSRTEKLSAQSALADTSEGIAAVYAALAFLLQGD